MPVHVPSSPTSSSASRAMPVTVGRTVAAGGAASTMAVTPVIADTEPAALVAVTRARRRLPMSAAVSVYVVAVAPATGAQAAPVASQRSHA